MPGLPSDGDYQDLILREIGASDDVTSTQVSLIWEMHSAEGTTSKRSQYLHTKLDALKLLLGDEWQSTGFSAHGRSFQEQQRFEHLLQLRNDTLTELASYTKQQALGTAPSVGTLTTRAPLTSYVYPPDPYAPDLPPGYRVEYPR